MHERRRSLPRRLGPESGQAMVEACVGLALLGLAWALLFYYSQLTSAATRSAVAARHAAWSAANGVAVSSDSLGNEIFFDSMAVSLTQSTGRSTTGGMLGGGNPALAVIFAMFPQIRKADVSSTPAAGTRVFNLTNVRFPIVHTGPELTYVSAHCEWDSVNKNWDDLDEILGDMF